jgi:hypothetical protein
MAQAEVCQQIGHGIGGVALGDGGKIEPQAAGLGEPALRHDQPLPARGGARYIERGRIWRRGVAIGAKAPGVGQAANGRIECAWLDRATARPCASTCARSPGRRHHVPGRAWLKRINRLARPNG